jgi:hypothetical protein
LRSAKQPTSACQIILRGGMDGLSALTSGRSELRQRAGGSHCAQRQSAALALMAVALNQNSEKMRALYRAAS